MSILPSHLPTAVSPVRQRWRYVPAWRSVGRRLFSAQSLTVDFICSQDGAPIATPAQRPPSS